MFNWSFLMDCLRFLTSSLWVSHSELAPCTRGLGLRWYSEMKLKHLSLSCLLFLSTHMHSAHWVLVYVIHLYTSICNQVFCQLMLVQWSRRRRLSWYDPPSASWNSPLKETQSPRFSHLLPCLITLWKNKVRVRQFLKVFYCKALMWGSKLNRNSYS